MRDMTVNEVILVAGVIAFSTFIAVPIVADYQQLGWTALLERWQTLVGGTLAVFAAWYTVRQMRESDRRGEKRHRQLLKQAATVEKANNERHVELMNLTLRPQWGKIERALTPQMLELNFAASGLTSSLMLMSEACMHAIEEWMVTDQLRRMLAVKSVDRKVLQGIVSEHRFKIREDLETLASVLSRPHFVAAEDMFSGRTIESIQMARKGGAELLVEMDDFIDSRQSVGHVPADLSVDYLGKFNQLAWIVSQLHNDLDALARRIPPIATF